MLRIFPVALMLFGALAGCATSPVGPSDEELVLRAVNKFTAGLKNASPSTSAKVLSEKFQHPEYGGKADFVGTLDQFNDIGYFEDLMVSNTAVTRVDGDTAVVAPVGLEGTFGALTVRFDLAKESEGWRIVGLEMSGI